MQILVLYHSRSGNTKQLAEAVAAGVREVEGAECVLRSVDEVTREEFAAADGVVAGSPVYFGTMSAELKAIFDDFVSVRAQMEGKVGAAFATSGDASGGKETTMLSIIQALLIYGMVVAGDPMAATGHYGVACADAPDERARRHGAMLGHRVAALALKLSTAREHT